MNTLTNLVLNVSYPETGFGVMLLISQALGIPPICEVGNPLIRIEIGIKLPPVHKKLLVHSGPDPSNSILVLVARSHHHQTSAHRN